MKKREAMLRELHLYPLWKLREGRGTAPENPAMPAPPVEAGLQPAPVLEERAISPADAASTANVGPQPVALAPAAETLDEAGTSRIQHIAGLDWPELRVMVRDCTACRLRAGCTQTVFGVGDEQADWLFVGEGPGADEDIKGEPFVGQAGKLLDSMLASIKLRRGDNVFIANIVKCRPPNNRTPAADEIATCIPYLWRQIALIRPKLIVALGKTAATSLLKRDVPIGSLRGKLHDYQGISLIVTYHPAYLLRSPMEKAKAWEDLCFAVRVMRGEKS
ncbi:MAG TPA: uracil-DNA glycosylase [Gallionella sp.]|nr:uracil-DNA glycosylase [Gallionella sp.]